MVPQFYLYSVHYGNPFADIATHYLGIGEKAAETLDTRTFSKATFNYAFDLPYIIGDWIFYLFLIGLLLFFFDLVLGFDKIFQNEESQKKFFVLFFVLCIFLIMGYIGSVSYVEQRYVTSALPFLFLITVSPLVKLWEIFEKNHGLSKKTSTILIIGILLILLFPNFMLGNKMIEEKKMSYSEVKEAGLLIMENSNPKDIIISGSLPQITYYSERTVYPFGLDGSLEVNETIFLGFVKINKPRYYILSSFEVTPEWAQIFPETNPGLLVPVQTYKQGGNYVLIIYEFKYD